MTDEMLHPTSERLEAYIEGDLADGERAVLESHLIECPRCQAEIEEWRSLFAGLAALPRPAPMPGFADRVLQGVRIRLPWRARIAALVQQLLPHTTNGWALAAVFLTLPMLLAGGVLTWLFARPWLTIEGVLLFLQQRTAQALEAFGNRTLAVIIESDLALWLASGANAVLSRAGLTGLGAAFALFAVLTATSAWILYRNLIRTPTRDTRHVSYCL